jgi:hypothetical protein
MEVTINLTNDGKGKDQSWEAEFVGLDLPGHINFGFGSTKGEAFCDLSGRVAAYRDELSAALRIRINSDEVSNNTARP